ncbi:hypothetical protein [Pseudomonas sp. MAG733B]|uniref:hypothetical protein n=1 Tax=Pseudomonas sp. MAG733B TaxID=3122079 RepID=UPI0030D0061D
MYDYKYDNVVVRFWTHRGEILSRERRREPVEYEIEDEYWVRTPDGLELQLVLGNPDFRFRKGDDLSVVYVGDAKGTNGLPAIVCNYSVSQSVVLTRPEWVYARLVPPRSHWIPALVTTVLSGIAAYFFGFWWGASAGFGFYLLLRVEAAKRKKRIIGGLGAHLEQLRERVPQDENRVDVSSVLARNL